jgi:hypothetical protein
MYPDSDQDAPGSEISTEDGDIDGVATQLTEDDTLDDTGVEDPLDRGYSPPDREPAAHIPTTPEEARRGETLDERLAEERDDVDAEKAGGSRDTSRVGRLHGAGGRSAHRAGRGNRRRRSERGRSRHAPDGGLTPEDARPNARR